jgi:hypothetical protein
MDFNCFSASTRKCLESSGWYPSRIVPIQAYADALRLHGFELNDPATEFLGSFGDLVVRFPHPDLPGITQELSFDIGGACQTASVANLRMDSQEIEANLCIIGDCWSGDLTLTMSPDGRVFGSDSTFLACVALSGCQAIETLVAGKDFVKLYHGEES